MWVKPIIPGAVLRDPKTWRQLPDEGGEVEESSYWLRRLNGIAGSAPDVERITPPVVTEPPSSAEPPAEAPSSPQEE